MSYRTTPNTTTGVTPSELFLGRRMNTRLDILRPNLLAKVTGKQTNQKYIMMFTAVLGSLQ